jgi:hypothetical protein
MAFNFGTNNGPTTGNNNMFGGFNIPSTGNMPNTTGMFGMPTVQPNNLQVLSTTSREYAENYNVAPGHTIVFINYNGRRLYIKTQNQNGLSYEMEEMVILKPEEFQQIQQAAVQNNLQSQKQEIPEKYVSLDQYGKDFNSIGGAIIELKDRFEKLEKQFEEFIK